MGRSYFPELDLANFTNQTKEQIEASIKEDFDLGYQGIRQLPRKAKLGVYVAYVYYLALFRKIKILRPNEF